MRCQPYPQKGQLAKGLNLGLDALRSRLRNLGIESDTVYCYVVATVRNANGHFCQTGSAPNFQRGVITLCTCKHHMRTFLEPAEWVGKWIAGFTGIHECRGANSLVYLMRVGRAFVSHRDLWFSSALTEETKKAKAADKNELGDVYRPRSQIAPAFRPSSYFEPIDGHPHKDASCEACSNTGEWHKDVNYHGCSGRRPALLIGDIEFSFLWERPMIELPSERKLHRGQKKCRLSVLRDQLVSR